MSDQGNQPTTLEQSILAHLRANCAFAFVGNHDLHVEQVSFYPDTWLCRLTLRRGTTLVGGKRKQPLGGDAEFRFLFRDTLGDELLIPLANDRSNILLANRLLGLTIRNDKDRMEYVRFYYGVSRVERRGETLNIPDTLEHVGFNDDATPEDKSNVFGAMWRFLDRETRTRLAVKFEDLGLFQWARYRAYVPAQLANALFDIELKIWRRNGHVTYNKSALIYEGDALKGVPLPRLGKIALPGYIRWSERVRSYFGKLRATLGRATYAAAALLFALTSIVTVAFLLEFAGVTIVRQTGEHLVSMIGVGTWKVPLAICAAYCILYFTLTTTLILDIDTIRDTLLRWVPKIEGSRVDNILYEISRRQHRSERGYKPPMWKRLLSSGFLLVFWSLYLIAVFTAYDATLQKSDEPANSRPTALVIGMISSKAAMAAASAVLKI